jgi:hypothetical protein
MPLRLLVCPSLFQKDYYIKHSYDVVEIEV